MKTTIEIPDPLFAKAKATAALRGETLKEFVTEALEARLASHRESITEHTGWRSVFGLGDRRALQRVDRFVSAGLEEVDTTEWR